MWLKARLAGEFIAELAIKYIANYSNDQPYKKCAETPYMSTSAPNTSPLLALFRRCERNGAERVRRAATVRFIDMHQPAAPGLA
jgi:hypothetical protein